MAYYVVYKSNIHKRMLQNGLTQHYVMIGVYNSEQALKMHGAIHYNRFNREEDATKDWDAHCRQMQKSGRCVLAWTWHRLRSCGTSPMIASPSTAGTTP